MRCVLFEKCIVDASIFISRRQGWQPSCGGGWCCWCVIEQKICEFLVMSTFDPRVAVHPCRGGWLCGGLFVGVVVSV